MRTKETTIYLLFFMLFSVYVNAQLSASFSSMESICVNNGSLTIDPSNGVLDPINNTTSYQYTITNGPTNNGESYPLDAQVSPNNTFASLAPGNYTIVVEDLNDAANGPFTGMQSVAGTYQQPRLDLDGTKPDCPDDPSGTITGIMTRGLPPYTYELISGPETRPVQNDGIFENLPAGTYTVRSYDNCDNFQTREYTLVEEDYDDVLLLSSGSPQIEKISCTEAIYKTGAIRGRSPYVFEVVNPPLGVNVPSQDNGVFTLPLDGAPYTFRVTDACGMTDDFVYNNPTPRLQYSVNGYECDGLNITLRPSFLFGPYQYNVITSPTGYDGEQTNTSGVFTNLPYGSYRFGVTDACDITRFISFTRERIDPAFNPVAQERPDFCVEGTGALSIRLADRNLSREVYVTPIDVELLNPPAAYSEPTTKTLQGNTISTTFTELPPGDYEFKITDPCGGEATEVFTLTETLEAQLTATLQIGCVEDNQILADFITNSTSNGRYTLINNETNVRIGPQTSKNFINLESGTYTLEYDAVCTWDTVLVIPDYIQPDVNPTRGYVCDDTDLINVTGIAEGGRLPYTFDLLDKADNSVLVSGNTECLFEDLDPSGEYRVRVIDACGNTQVSDVSNINTELGLSIEGDDCEIQGNDFPWSIQEIPSATYTWTLPDATTFVGVDISAQVGLIQETDFGMYTLDIDFDNGCRTQTISKELADCAQLVPLTWNEFVLSKSTNYVDAKWSTSDEINTSHFIIERSYDRITWDHIGEVEAKANSGELNEYQFLDRKPHSGLNYYRLKQIDLDGAFDYSLVKSISLEREASWSISPNPSSGRIILDHPLNSDQTIESIQIFDLSGKMVHKTEDSSEINTDLESGVYIVKVLGEREILHIQRLNIVK